MSEVSTELPSALLRHIIQFGPRGGLFPEEISFARYERLFRLLAKEGHVLILGEDVYTLICHSFTFPITFYTQGECIKAVPSMHKIG